MVSKELISALEQMEKEKGISKVVLLGAIQDALVSALKRNFGNTQNLSINIDQNTGHISVMAQKKVVEKVLDPQFEVRYEEVLKNHKDCKVGDSLMIEITPSNFGRIAAQTAKQVIVQRIREAERDLLYREFVNRKGDIITGVIQKVEQGKIYIDLGNIEAVLTPSEQVPSEKYRQGDRIKAYILDVKLTNKGPQVILSRTHPAFLNRLFEFEVPEIYEKIVEIKSTSREAGYRSKIAVASNQNEVDPVGACVGARGGRVLSVVQELRGEKIDIVLWDKDPTVFISNALNPAKVISVEVRDDNSALVVVPDSQLSLAIGKEGQNARLAAKLTGWKIDIKNKTIYEEEAKKNKIMDDVISSLVENLQPVTVVAVEVQEKEHLLILTTTLADYITTLGKIKELSLDEPCKDWKVKVQPHIEMVNNEFPMEEVADVLMKLLEPVNILSLQLNKKERKLLITVSKNDEAEVIDKQGKEEGLSSIGEWNIVFEIEKESDSTKSIDETIVPILLDIISPVNVISLEVDDEKQTILIYVPFEELQEAREKIEKSELPDDITNWKLAIEAFNIEEK